MGSKGNAKMFLLIVGGFVMAVLVGGVAFYWGANNPSQPDPLESIIGEEFDVMDYANKLAVIETEKGDIKLELYPDAAPKTVENFVRLIEEGYYDGVTWHRVIPDFMIQGGDPNSKNDDPEDDGSGGYSWWGGSFEDEINAFALGLDSIKVKDAEFLANIYPPEQLAENADLSVTAFYESLGYVYDDSLPTSYMMLPGSLAMANSGPNTNGSQFFIVTNQPQPHLNGKHTVFGMVYDGMDVVNAIEQGDVMTRVYIEDKPQQPKDEAAELNIPDSTADVSTEDVSE